MAPRPYGRWRIIIMIVTGFVMLCQTTRDDVKSVSSVKLFKAPLYDVFKVAIAHWIDV